MLSIALLLTALTSTAQADPHMWGVGPTVSTVVFPVTYPGKLPTAVPSSASTTTSASSPAPT